MCAWVLNLVMLEVSSIIYLYVFDVIQYFYWPVKETVDNYCVLVTPVLNVLMFSKVLILSWLSQYTNWSLDYKLHITHDDTASITGLCLVRMYLMHLYCCWQVTITDKILWDKYFVVILVFVFLGLLRLLKCFDVSICDAS